MNVRHTMGVLHSFSIKNIFYDKIELRLFHFRKTICMSETYARTMHFYAGIVHNIYSCQKYMHVKKIYILEIRACQNINV